MPPKSKFTKEDILSTALALTRESGIEALTARTLGAKLGASTKPIFGLFENMAEVRTELMRTAAALYHRYLEEDMARGKYPPYKASGMSYIRFAKEEPSLFRLLFMRDRSHEENAPEREKERDSIIIDPIIQIIQKNLGLSEQDAHRLHLEMWVTVHGIAVMTATSYLLWDEETISDVLTDVYMGLKARFSERSQQ